MRFESVVFADTAQIAVLSCFARLNSEKTAGRRTLLITLGDAPTPPAIAERGLAEVRRFEEVEADGGGLDRDRPWRERIALLVRRLGPRHVLAPLGLLGAPQAIDYFGTLRSALSVDRGRDLLFFEERPHCLVPEAVPLRLAGKAVRLPPASQLRRARRYLPFAARFLVGWGTGPVFGGVAARARIVRGLKPAFQEAADWDPHKALGPKVQPLAEPWLEDNTVGLFGLAADLGVEKTLGSLKTFRRRMVRHANRGGSRAPVERYWLSLPDPVDSMASGEDD